MDTWKKYKTWVIAGVFAMQSMGTWADEFSASFKGTDIQEFIEVVGRNLGKTIIVDPTVQGKVNVRSYDVLNDAQYYQFFLNVLEVYGFAVVEMENGILKVINDKDAKQAAVPVVGDNTIEGDVVITRVVSVKNVTVRELSPLLRQLIDNAGAGNVVHYDPANIIMITGRAAAVNRLAEIINRIDRAGDTETEIVNLIYASASEMVRIVESLHKKVDGRSTPALLQLSVVAEERTNSILISGERQVRERIRKLISQLDHEMATTGNSRVIYLRYAKAEDVMDVLKGVSDNLVAEKKGVAKISAFLEKNIHIAAHKRTNSIVVTAPPDIMQTLEGLISQLDIRRAQVLIEAMIVEVSQNDGVNLGIQMGASENGGIQFANTGVSLTNYLSAQEQAKTSVNIEKRFDKNNNPLNVNVIKPSDPTAIAKAFSHVSGLATAIQLGKWTALVTAVSSDTDSNILSSPSLMVLDNEEASFIVGEEVPVVNGITMGSSNDKPFKTIERKDVGIKLKVTPQINEGDSVQLTIEQEISNVLGANGAVDIRFSKRQLTTTVLVADQQMIVLSGLIDELTMESEKKVPILGDIPILGHLFKSTSINKTKRNLMLFIKPTILRSGLTANGATQRKYNYIRAEQILHAQKDVKLMYGVTTPVLPQFGADLMLPTEVHAIMAELR
ncbi:type II secretion system secretin GspD [Candidatus Enterovibrio escicola]|uniref:General secretion pathway protein D n=1 Tax=Candidatus Enterovibrio escicola TaxID=1927127 RepID=A0A2A5SZ14_9GAMM|nr:type II secretion system secretin GspD [Candidatus Enterovibrio escacola]PCS21131.1 General secretion pathway protein D [Candidatus Enterovibrio escacola]